MALDRSASLRIIQIQGNGNAFLALASTAIVALAERLRITGVTRHIVQTAAFLSFALYLFHRPTYALLLRLYKPSTGIRQIVYLYAVGFPVCVCFAFLIQRTYDAVAAAASHATHLTLKACSLSRR